MFHICIMPFDMLSRFEHNPYDRLGLLEARVKWRNDRVVSGVSKPFSILNANSLIITKTEKCDGASTTLVVLAKRNRTCTVIHVNKETPVTPFRSSTVAIYVRNRPTASQTLKGVQLLCCRIKLMQTVMEKDTGQEIQLKSGEAYQVHWSTLRTELGMFDKTSASLLLTGYSVNDQICVKYLTHDWPLNCCLPPVLRNQF